MDITDQKPKRKRGRPRKEDKEKEKPEKKLEPLKTASERIANMLCSLSGDEELFVIDSDGSSKRRLDTKTLKEFSSVIKEISSVICELNGLSGNDSKTEGQILIEFDGSSMECSE